MHSIFLAFFPHIRFVAPPPLFLHSFFFYWWKGGARGRGWFNQEKASIHNRHTTTPLNSWQHGRNKGRGGKVVKIPPPPSHLTTLSATAAADGDGDSTEWMVVLCAAGCCLLLDGAIVKFTRRSKCCIVSPSCPPTLAFFPLLFWSFHTISIGFVYLVFFRFQWAALAATVITTPWFITCCEKLWLFVIIKR